MLRLERLSPNKPYKLSDGGGLFLLVRSSKKTGVSKWWRLKYRFGGKEKLLSFGTYPEITLVSARKKREVARKLLAEEIDPGQEKKAAKASASGAGTFEAVAREWHAKFSPGWAASHSAKLLRRLELYIFPWIGTLPIAKVEAHEVLSTIQRIEAKGNLETARRALQKMPILDFLPGYHS